MGIDTSHVSVLPLEYTRISVKNKDTYIYTYIYFSLLRQKSVRDVDINICTIRYNTKEIIFFYVKHISLI